jgi:general secretion pathway protein D
MFRSIPKHLLRTGALAAVVWLAGCASLSHPQDDNSLQREAMAGTQNPVPAPLPLTNDINGNAADTTASSSEISHGSGQFIHPVGLNKPRPAVSGPGTVSFNFENQPVQAVVKAILGDLLKQNYTIVPGVQGNISFATSEEVDASQALPILETLLSWTHNALIQRNGGYVVVPEKDAVAGNLVPSLGAVAPMAGMQARLFPLHYISATEMEKLIKPFARPDSVLLANPSRNLLVVSGTPDELANYQSMVRTFDVDWLRGMSVGVFSLQYANVAELMPKLDGMFGPHGDTPLAGMLRFIPIERTNALVVISTQPAYLQEVGDWITTIDRGGGNQPRLFVYDVRNLKASDLAKYLAQIYTNGAGNNGGDNGGKTGPGLNGATLGSADNSSANSMGSTAGSFGNSGGSMGSTGSMGGSMGSGGSLGSSGTGGLGSTSGFGGSGGFGGNSTDSRDGSGSSAFGSSGTNGSSGNGNGSSNDQQYASNDGSVKISSVDANNQLLVHARPAQWEEMKEAIKKLDNVPLQVQIETRILEVSLTGEFQFGVQWYLEGLTGSTSNNGSITPGQPYRHRQIALGGDGKGGLNTSFTGQPFFYSFLNSQMQVAVSALETNGNAKTLSAPSMVVMNNQVGSIQVGDNIPINSTSVNATIGATTSLNEVSYINTGVILNVLPRINPGGLVYMNISQEVSQSDSTIPLVNGNPTIQQRKLATQVAVQSGQTVLLGGLIQQQDTSGDTGIPGLNRIPVLGRLFGSTDRKRNRTELIVLITPRVIRGSEDAKQVTDDYQSKFESLAPLRASAKPSVLKTLANFEPPPTLTPVPPAVVTAAPSWPEQLQQHAESALQQGDTATALDMATQSWKQGTRRGDLCVRNWQTIGAVRKQRGDGRGVNAASKQQTECLAPTAPQ